MRSDWIEVDFPKEKTGKRGWRLWVNGKIKARSRVGYACRRDALKGFGEACAMTEATWTFLE